MSAEQVGGEFSFEAVPSDVKRYFPIKKKFVWYITERELGEKKKLPDLVRELGWDDCTFYPACMAGEYRLS